MRKLLSFLFFTTVLSVLCTFSIFASDAVAKVGDTEYQTLQEAIDAAGTGDTVILLTDLTVESSSATGEANGYFVIAENDKITIDLNGKTITATDNSTSNFVLFYNRGELTIKNGTVNLTATIDREWNALSDIFMNRGGSLTIESGEYNHLGGTSMAFVLDNSGNSFGDAYAYVNGGTLTSTYTAIRMRMADTTLNGNPGNGTVYLSITGGTVYGANRGVWGQITNAFSGELGTLEVTGGTVGGGKQAINIATDGYKNIYVTVLGNAYIDGALKGEGADFNISGGTFTSAVSSDFLANGFTIVENSDGTYSVAVSLESAFVFLGYSVNENVYSSITAGYRVNHEVIAAYCEQNEIESFDFGCAFGINAINEATAISFTEYVDFAYFNVKITGIDSSKESHLNAILAMALYFDLGAGKQYVCEIDGEIAFVDRTSVTTVTYAEFMPTKE